MLRKDYKQKLKQKHLPQNVYTVITSDLSQHTLPNTKDIYWSEKIEETLGSSEEKWRKTKERKSDINWRERSFNMPCSQSYTCWNHTFQQPKSLAPCQKNQVCALEYKNFTNLCYFVYSFVINVSYPWFVYLQSRHGVWHYRLNETCHHYLKYGYLFVPQQVCYISL